MVYFSLSNKFPSSFQNKKCGNRSCRTEKRQLQLSPNKTNFTDKHHMQVSGASIFAGFHLTYKNRYRYKTPYKNRAFILKNYLVLFGNFIISQLLAFVNIFRDFFIFREVEILPLHKEAFLTFIYTLSFLLTSTAFVSTNAKIRHTSFEIYRISENCPLEYDPKTARNF